MLKRLLGDRRNQPTSPAELTGTAVYLWGGVLDSVELDLVRGEAVLAAHIVEEGSTASVSIRCHGLSEVSFTNTVPWPWNYAEITEVYARRVSAGVRLELTLWVDETTLAVTAEEIWIGDQRLVEPFDSVAGHDWTPPNPTSDIPAR